MQYRFTQAKCHARYIFATCIAAMTMSCSDTPPASAGSPEATLTIAPAEVVADGIATAAVSVAVRGADGRALSGYAVALEASGDDNTLVQPPGVTGADGVVSGTLASTKAEEKTILARVTSAAGDVVATTSDTVSFVAGAVAGFVLEVTDPVEAGGVVTVVVTAVDAFGNVVTSYTGNVTVSFSDTLSLSPVTYAFTAGDQGTHTFTTGPANTAGTGTVTVHDGDHELLATYDGFRVHPGSASALRYDVQPIDVGERAIMAPAIVVAVTDVYGNIVPEYGAEIVLALATNAAGVMASGTLTRTAVGGLATFDDLSFDKPAEGLILQASAGSLAPALSDPFDVFDATPPQVASVTPTSDATAGRDAVITISFSEPMDPTSVNAGSVVVTLDGTPVAGVITYGGGLTATFQPSARLAVGTCTVTLTAAARDVRGNSATPFSSSFTVDRHFADPVPLDTAQGVAPQIAMDGAGRAVVLFANADSPREQVARRFDPGSGWADAETFTGSAGSIATGRVAMDDDGRALAVWPEEDSSWQPSVDSLRYADGAWGTGQGWLTQSTTMPAVAASGTGVATMVFGDYQTFGRVAAATFSPGPPTSWSTPEILDSGSARDPQVAMNATGDALAVWRSDQGFGDCGSYGSVKAATKAAAVTTWITFDAISTGDVDECNDPWAARVASSHGATGMVAWVGYDYTGGVHRLWETTFDGADFAAATAHTAVSDGNVDSAALAMDAAGNALIVFALRPPSEASSVFAIRYVQGTGFAAAEPLEDDELDAMEPAVALNDTGEGLAVWRHSSSNGRWYLRASRFSPATGWRESELIPGADYTDEEIASQQVAIDNNGDAIVVYETRDGSYVSHVLASRLE